MVAESDLELTTKASPSLPGTPQKHQGITLGKNIREKHQYPEFAGAFSLRFWKSQLKAERARKAWGIEGDYSMT